MSGKHIIHRQVFAFDIPDEQSYPAFSRRISELQSSSLFEELDRLLTELIPEDLHIRIDRIELDVGVIDIDELGDILIRRVLEELHRQLAPQRRGPSAVRLLDVDPGTRDRRLLEYFVHHGRLPWWAPSQGTSIRQVAARLLHGDLRSLRPLFDSLRHDPVKIRRWLGHVDTKDLVPVWKMVHPAWGGLTDGDALRLVEAAIRLSAHALGREASRDAIRYILLSDILETETSGKGLRTHAPDPRNPLSLLRKATPFTGLSDISQRFRTLHTREGRWGMPAADPGAARATGHYPHAIFPLEGAAPSPSARTGDATAIHSEGIAEFRSFLQTGHLERYRSRSMLTELVRLFRGLVLDELPSLEDAILDLGRSVRVRRRILDNLSSPDIRFFFERAVPDKKELLDWVSNVYLETQRKMRPINQTDIRVKRSVDEITLEIYTSTDLNAITNEAFLRMHLRRMGLKHHIRYEDLLRRIVESVAMPPLPLSSRFIDLLRRIYTEDILGVADSDVTAPRTSSRGEVDEGTLRELYRSSEDLADHQTLRTRLQTLARRRAIPYGRLLAALSTSLDHPPVPVSAGVLKLLRRVIALDGPGMSAPGDEAPERGVVSLPSAVADIFRLSDGKERIPDLKTLRAELKESARQQGISYGRFLAAVAASLDRPPIPISGAFLSRLRRVIAQDMPGSDAGMDGSYVADGTTLDTSVADFFRWLDGRGRIPDVKTLRAELQKSARQQGISYGRFLAAVAASLDRPPIPLSAGFLERLRRVIDRDMPGTDAGMDGSYVADGTTLDTSVADFFRWLDGRGRIPDVKTLRAELQKSARQQGISYGRFLAAVAASLDRPPIPLSAGFLERLRRVIARDMPGTDAGMDGASLAGKATLDPAVADVFRLAPDDKGGIPDLNTLRTRLRNYAEAEGIPYEELLSRVALALDSPPMPAAAILVDRLRKLAAERATFRTDGVSSGQSLRDVSSDKALLEVLRMTDLTALTDASELRTRLRRIAAEQSLGYETLLGRLSARVAAREVQVPDRFSALLRELHAKDAPDAGEKPPASKRSLPSAAGGLSDTFLREVLSSREWMGIGDVASLRRHLHQVAGRALIPYRDLLTELMVHLSESPPRAMSRVVGLLRQVHREDITRRGAPDALTGEPADSRPAVRREMAAEMSSGEASALRYVAEPVPDELLRLLTRDVMRALVLAKGTGIFGKSTRALQDLITAYIRIGGEVPKPDSVPAEELRRRLSEYLDLDASFLAYAMAFTARMHPEDGSVRELSALLSVTQAPSSGKGRQLSEAEVAALVRHLSEYRVYYEAAHVKSLVLPALKGIRIGRDVFTEVMRLLFGEDASLVVATLHRILDRSGALPAGPARDATDEVYRAFIVSALDVRNASFGLNRVFADVRRRLQPDREEPFVLPSRLSEVRMSFAGDMAGQAGRKGARSQGGRENTIIRLYNILHLDLLLEDAGPRFFDNIPFSFELLLTRYRQQLLDILHVKRLDPELAHFFAYSDQSRIFEQIRTLYPRTKVERVSRVFGHAVELLQRSRWLNLGREQALSFGMLDSFAHVFSREDAEPAVSDIVLDILRRAAETRLLSRAFMDIFRDPDDASVLRRLGRRLGLKRLERLLPSVAGSPAARAEAIRQRIRLLRDIIPKGGREAREREIYLSLSAILEAGTFPPGHPYEGQTLESQSAYLARMVTTGRVLARLLSDRPPRHPAAVLLGAVEPPLIVSTIVQRFGVDRTSATRLFSFWSSRSGSGGMPPEELMREILLLRPVREEEKGVEALRRAILTFLTSTGRVSRWQVLEYLSEEGVGPTSREVRPITLPAVIREGASLAGAEAWYEFYFGVLTDPSAASSEGYRAVHAWAEYLFRHPAGRTRQRLLTLLQDAFLRAREGAGREAESLHAGFLEALRPFEGLRASDARRVLQDLMHAGVPPEALAGYLEGRKTREGGSLTELLQAEAGGMTTAPASVTGRLRGIPTPREILADLSRAGGPGGRVMAGLRRWVDARPWTPSETERFAELLPPPALEALLKSIAPSADLPGIVQAWADTFRVTGWKPDARKARQEVLGILFSERLWRHRSASAIHAAILTASGLPRALREGRLIPDTAVSVPGGMPPALWSRLMEIPAGEEGRMGAEEVTEAWALSMERREMAESDSATDGNRTAEEVAADTEAVAFFLETGRVPGLGRVAKTSPEYMALVRRVASMGVARFLSFRRLHVSQEESVLEFFPAAQVTQHIFGVLLRQASDPALRDFLQSFAEEAARTRVRLATLVRFLRLFRTRVGTRPILGNAAVDGFLAEALRIPGFEVLVERVAQSMPADTVRATRSRFLRRSVREARRRSAQPGGRLDEAVWFFLRTGMVRASYGVDTVEQLAERLQERIRTGDGVYRGMLFTRLREESARRRVRRLLAGMEEREVYAYIHTSLDRELSELVRMMRQRFGIDVWRAVGARTDRDRIERVLQWWAGTRSRPDAPMRMLRLFMEEATAMLDARQLDRIRRPAPGLLTASERELWTELRALLPDWLDAPPDEDRKLRKPQEKEGGPAMNDPEPAPDPAEGIPVRNGGLVLLWPFLGRLFSRLQLTDGKNFLGDRELSRAIRLTEYLVTGRTDMEEHQLALNKVICGAPLDFEVPAELDITPEESDLGMKMIQGAIRNWEKLKTTKPETFRESFLRREAILYRVEQRWELVVQRKPYDMLLDTLPWNITMIQLSWMPDRLVVQWK